MVKTKTGTSAANTAQVITITSPNIKTIKIFAYCVSFKAAAVNAADITIDIKDEDGNVLWSDVLPRGAATSVTPRATFNFGNRPLYLPPGKNATINISAGGAAIITVGSVQYDL